MKATFFALLALAALSLAGSAYAYEEPPEWYGPTMSRASSTLNGTLASDDKDGDGIQPPVDVAGAF